jgi:hypothetical protein
MVAQTCINWDTAQAWQRTETIDAHLSEEHQILGGIEVSMGGKTTIHATEPVTRSGSSVPSAIVVAELRGVHGDFP